MATSPDGITWTKYNDPSTTQAPYAESDPVPKPGNAGDWDSDAASYCCVLKKTGYFEMYYSGWNPNSVGFGYASSVDGISWNAEAFPAGIYYYRIQAGEEAGSGKMIIAK